MSVVKFSYWLREGLHRPLSRIKFEIRDLSVCYGAKRALRGVSLDIHDRETLALIGPSGCGKSTLLRALNRMNDEVHGAQTSGTIRMDGRDIHDPSIETGPFRGRFGWVAQVPNPFPWSVRENVAYGARINGVVDGQAETEDWVRECLQVAGLWEEVKDDLSLPGNALSGGQQQRLCIARALACKAEVLLMDEPTASLDPVATRLVEDLVYSLSESMTVVIITHNLHQAGRMAQRIAHLHEGEVRMSGDAEAVLLRPDNPVTAAFVGGRVG